MPFTSLTRKVSRSLAIAVLLVTALVAVTFFVNVEDARGQTGDDHSDRLAGATPIALGDSIAGRIDPGDDQDIFLLDLRGKSGVTDVWLYTTGELDTFGGLFDVNGSRLVLSDDGNIGLPDERANFHIRWSVPAGVYYIGVFSYKDAIGDYSLHARTATDPGGITLSAAPRLGLGSVVAGTIGSDGDEDYFRLDLTSSQNLVIDAVGLLRFGPTGQRGPFTPVTLQVLDSRGAEIPVNIRPGRTGVRIRDDFAPGTHFVRVDIPEASRDFPVIDESYPVPYIINLYEDVAYTNWLDGCEAATDSLDNSVAEDPLYGCQWHLKNLEPGGHDINVEGVWEDGYNGEGVNVVVVDTTVNYGHEDLKDNVDYGRNHDYDGQDGAFRPYEHHGTYVAGVIAGRDNEIGVRGVAPRSNYLRVQFAERRGNSRRSLPLVADCLCP